MASKAGWLDQLDLQTHARAAVSAQGLGALPSPFSFSTDCCFHPRSPADTERSSIEEPVLRQLADDTVRLPALRN